MLYTQLFSNFQPKTKVFDSLKAVFKSTTVAALGFCVLISITASASGLPKVSPQTLPNSQVQITNMDGRSMTLANYKGSPLLVNFWAMWCPPCVVELPALERAVAPLGAQSVKILLVSVDRGSSEKVVSFLRKNGVISPEIAFDPQGILSRHLGVRGLPTTFLLSADQTKSWAFEGPFEWDTQPVQQDLWALLSP